MRAASTSSRARCRAARGRRTSRRRRSLRKGDRGVPRGAWRKLSFRSRAGRAAGAGTWRRAGRRAGAERGRRRRGRSRAACAGIRIAARWRAARDRNRRPGAAAARGGIAMPPRSRRRCLRRDPRSPRPPSGKCSSRHSASASASPHVRSSRKKSSGRRGGVPAPPLRRRHVGLWLSSRRPPAAETRGAKCGERWFRRASRRTGRSRSASPVPVSGGPRRPGR